MPTQEEIAREDFLATARGAPSYQPAWDTAVEAGYEASPFQGYSDQELEQERADIVKALSESRKGEPESDAMKANLKEWTEQLAEIEAAQELMRRESLMPQESLRPDYAPQPALEIKGERPPDTSDEELDALFGGKDIRPPNTTDEEWEARERRAREDMEGIIEKMERREIPEFLKKKRRLKVRRQLPLERPDVELEQTPAPDVGEEVKPGESMGRKKTAFEIAKEAETAGELPEDEHLHLLEEKAPLQAASDARAKKVGDVRERLMEILKQMEEVDRRMGAERLRPQGQTYDREWQKKNVVRKEPGGTLVFPAEEK